MVTRLETDHSFPRSIEDIFSEVTVGEVLQHSDGRASNPSAWNKEQWTEKILAEIQARLTGTLARVRQIPIPEYAEFMLIPNLLPATEASIHDVLLQKIEPDRRFSEEFDRIQRDPKGAIIGVFQHKECPGVLPVVSADGTEHRWYVRRTGVIGRSKRVGGVNGIWVHADKPIEHLVLRRALPPTRALPQG